MPNREETSAQSFKAAVSANDVNYIMLKRNDGAGYMPALSLKRVFCLFAMLDKFLGGDGFADVTSEFWKSDETTDPTLQAEYERQITSNEILDAVIDSTCPMPESRQNKWALIIFSENFFSSTLWDSSEIGKVKKICRLLTDKHKKVVISANFLHKYEGKSDTPSRKKPKKKDYIISNDTAGVKLNRFNKLRYSNCSLIFWNGVPLSCYRKTTYIKGHSDPISAGYGYDFGDWKSYPTPELASALNHHKEFSKLFNNGKQQIIVSKTCSDMNYLPKLTKSIKLLILTANDSPGRDKWKEKVGKTNVCVCDGTRKSYLWISDLPKIPTPIQSHNSILKELLCEATVYYGGV